MFHTKIIRNQIINENLKVLGGGPHSHLVFFVLIVNQHSNKDFSYNIS